MKMTKKERETLVAEIEGGRYKTGQSTSVIALIIVVIVFFSMSIMTIAMGGIVLKGAGVIAGLMTLFPMFLPFLIVGILVFSNRAAHLSKLTPAQRNLILNGTLIEADLDSIEQRGNHYIFHCSADYAGYKYPFNSPAISVEPIPSSERKIPVFINPQNPNEYVIDIYDRLPVTSGAVLQDRSEMRVDPNKKNPNQSSTIVIIIVCCVFFIPFGLIGFVAGLGGIISGDPAGIIAAVVPLGIMGLVIWAMAMMSKRNKNLSETGYYIPATAQKFWVTRSKNSTTYHLSARYIEPSTKRAHEFQTTGPSSMKTLVGTTVNTYINPDNTREYFMDVRGALEHLGFTTSKDNK